MRPTALTYQPEGADVDVDISTVGAALVQALGATASARAWMKAITELEVDGFEDWRLREIGNTLATVQRRLRRLAETEGVPDGALDGELKRAFDGVREGVKELT